MTTLSTPSRRRADYALNLLYGMLGQLSAGDKLKPERELALELGVSRRVIREALEQLEREGRIARAFGRGTVVIKPQDDVQNKVFQEEKEPVTLPANGLIPPEIILGSSPLDLIDARFVLEPAIAAAAAMHASTQDIHEMYKLLEYGKNATEAAEWEKWDSALHQRIGAATHNSLLQYFYQVLSAARSQTEWGRLRKLSLNEQSQRLYCEQHTVILEAIQSRNPADAAEAMRTHLNTVKRTLIDGLN